MTDPGVGTITVDDGLFSLTPAPGASGRLQATYTVTDQAGGVSNPATVSLLVRPGVTGGSVSTHGTTPITHTLPPVVGSGPFTVAGVLSAPGVASASVTIDPDGRPQVTAQATDGFSGPTAVTFTVRDASGVTGEATLDITVHPVAGPGTVELTLGADGSATTTAALPAPAGSGPFTYALHSGPVEMTASLTPDGELTVSTDRSGLHTLEYTVTDGTSTSAPQTVTVTVRPYVGAVPTAEGSADGPVTAAAPLAHGTDLTWSATTPAGTDVVVAADGAVTLDTAGQSGHVVVHLTARDRDGVLSAPVSVVFAVRPVAQPVGGTATASDTPVPATLTPTPTGTGPFTPAPVTGLDPARGSAAVVAGDLEIRPASGVSGRLTVTYTVTDAHGLTSDPGTATLEVAPVVAGTSAEMTSGSVQTLALPEPVGTGGFTWDLVTLPPPAVATVVLDGPQLTVQADAAFSGPLEVHYRVADADGIRSAPAVLSMSVLPVAAPDGTGSPGSSPTDPVRTVTGQALTLALPTPAGTGPFTWELLTGPHDGTAVLDEATGALRFEPGAGRSGRFTVVYRVQDGAAQASAPQGLWLEVRPTAHDAAHRFDAGTPFTTGLPAPDGTGPFTWSLLGAPGPHHGTAALDAANGQLSFIRAAGTTGSVTLLYTVTDADGVSSAPAVVTLTAHTVPAVTPPAGPGPTAGPPAAAGPPAGSDGLPRTGPAAAPTVGAAAGVLVLSGLVLVRLHQVRVPHAPRGRHRAR